MKMKYFTLAVLALHFVCGVLVSLMAERMKFNYSFELLLLTINILDWKIF